MQTLLTCPFRIHEIGFGRVHKIEPRGELFIIAVHAKAVTVIVLGVHISAISQRGPLFLPAQICPATESKSAMIIVVNERRVCILR